MVILSVDRYRVQIGTVRYFVFKKRWMIGALLLVLLGLCAFFLWPLPFSGIAPDCASISVLRTEAAGPEAVQAETVSHNTEAFAQIQRIFDRYSYHRSLRTFFSDASITGNQAGYWLRLYLDTAEGRTTISCGGTGELLIDGRVYRMGYLGNDSALSMMRELVEAVGL